MEPSYGLHHLRRSGSGLPVAAEPVGEAMSAEDFDAALHRIEKQLRLNEWRLAVLLEGLEELSASLSLAAAIWEGVAT